MTRRDHTGLQIRRSGAVAAFIVTTLLFAGCSWVSEAFLGMPPYRTDVDKHERVMVSMRDGAKLTTDIYYPAVTAPAPALLIRNPYNMWDTFAVVAKALAKYGYVVVHQDVRGRFQSEGEWLPLLNERDDGLDTLDWLVEQPFHNGNIGLIGASYLSAVQWAVADRLPPEVKTMIPAVIGTDLRSALYEDGMFRHEVFTFWAALMPDHELATGNMMAYRKAIRHYPPIENDVRYFGKELRWYRQWLQSDPATAPLWMLENARLLGEVPGLVDIPVLMVSGWYDLFTKSQLRDFRNLRTRDRSRLIVGPWTHLMGAAGDGVKAFDNAGTLTDHLDKIINWLDHHLKGTPLDAWGPVMTYPIGTTQWAHRKQFPPPGTTTVRLYLDGASTAKGCHGGALRPTPSTRAEQGVYMYDPRNPVPSRGGGPLLAFVLPGWSDIEPSIRNQAGLCQRRDILTFTSPALTRPMHIAGGIDVRLTVASDAPDTAFTAKLIEVEDGRALNIRSSITSLAYRNGATVPVSYTPGTAVPITIDLWPIEWVVPAGAQLRLDVSSSDFPAYHAHANQAGPWAKQAQPRPAEQTIFTGPGQQAFLDLTVLP